jgi:hypothetical protein
MSVTAGWLPLPLSGTVCGLPGALSVTERLALRLPVALGLKLTEIEQLAPGARVEGESGQVFVCAKSPASAPVIPIELIVSAPLPELVRVTLCAELVVPTCCWPKLRLVGEKLTAGAVATPVPLSATVCGEAGALSVTETLAPRDPAALGVKVTEIEQLEPAASVEGLSGQVFVCAKSPAFVPVIPIELIVRAPVPVLVRVTLCAELVVPTSCWPKLRLVGENVTAGAGATPVPLSPTVCGEPGALSATETLALRLPARVGLKRTEIVQLAPAASVEGESGQVFVCAKSPAFAPAIPIELIVSGAVPVFCKVAV